MTRFDTDTAVNALGSGRYRGRMDRGWWIERGPNGGYVAAVILRALTAEVGDPARAPRSLTIHYLAPPAEGDVEVQATVERAGRSLTSISGRLTQDGQLLALALAAFSIDRGGPSFAELTPPDVPPAADVPPLARGPITIPMQERYDPRWAVGPLPFSAAESSEVGGWLRLTEPRPYDHALIAALADAWIPAIFARMSPEQRVGVPTVDLTVHFRNPPPPTLAPEDHVLVVFRTHVGSGGFLEEDGEIWTPDGILLAQSRQLAALLT